MIYSMTAYSEAEIPTEGGGALRWEIKSVNHRFLELFFKLPDWAREWEIPLREQARKTLVRGKIDCVLLGQPTSSQPSSFTLEGSMVEALMSTLSKLQEDMSKKVTVAPVSPLDLLKWPNVLKPTTLNVDKIKTNIERSFEQAIEKLLIMREKEGHMLTLLIHERVDKMAMIIQSLWTRLPKVMDLFKERILTKIKSLSLEVDPQRLEQELVYASNKMDIEEELDRFSTHLKAVKHCLESGGMVGRRLDFLMQELNREANTMASKSADSEISQSTLELRVLIEQVREQVQNLV